MWELRKKFHFEAAHFLPNHDGPCARMHGHSFRGEVVLRSHRLCDDGPKDGMVIDYAEVDDALQGIVQAFDHRLLNDVLAPRTSRPPTSEILAADIYTRLRDSSLSSFLYAVTIKETCTSACTFYGRDS